MNVTNIDYSFISDLKITLSVGPIINKVNHTYIVNFSLKTDNLHLFDQTTWHITYQYDQFKNLQGTISTVAPSFILSEFPKNTKKFGFGKLSDRKIEERRYLLHQWMSEVLANFTVFPQLARDSLIQFINVPIDKSILLMTNYQNNEKKSIAKRISLTTQLQSPIYNSSSAIITGDNKQNDRNEKIEISPLALMIQSKIMKIHNNIFINYIENKNKTNVLCLSRRDQIISHSNISLLGDFIHGLYKFKSSLIIWFIIYYLLDIVLYNKLKLKLLLSSSFILINCWYNEQIEQSLVLKSFKESTGVFLQSYLENFIGSPVSVYRSNIRDMNRSRRSYIINNEEESKEEKVDKLELSNYSSEYIVSVKKGSKFDTFEFSDLSTEAKLLFEDIGKKHKFDVRIIILFLTLIYLLVICYY